MNRCWDISFKYADKEVLKAADGGFQPIDQLLAVACSNRDRKHDGQDAGNNEGYPRSGQKADAETRRYHSCDGKQRVFQIPTVDVCITETCYKLGNSCDDKPNRCAYLAKCKSESRNKRGCTDQHPQEVIPIQAAQPSAQKA